MLFVVVFLVATAGIGASLGDVSDKDDKSTQHWATVHRLSGVAAALAVMFINGVVITYFVGTCRWCKEVVDTYNLDSNLTYRSAVLKRRAFPISLLLMLVFVVVVASGGAADPSAAVQPPPLGGVQWSTLHLVGVLLGMAALLYVAYFQMTCIRANQKVIHEILQNVREVRVAKGLDVSDG